MKKRKILIIIIILVIITAAFYFTFFKEEKPEYSLVKAVRGDILQEVSETGNVKMGEEIELSFKNTGRIEKIYVQVGQEVEGGQFLAKLDTIQLSIQLAKSESALEIAQAKLNQLLAGSTPEEIKIAETNVANAKASLDDQKQSLEDVKADTEEDLDAVYEDALNTLDDAYLIAYNAYNKADLIQRTYFVGNDQESITAQEGESKIKNNLDKAKDDLDNTKDDPKKENIDKALIEFESYLDNIYDALTDIRNTTETISYRSTISSADKTSLDTHKTNINTSLTDIVNDQQAISSTKITNTTNINTAEAKVSDADGALRKAEDELNLKTAGPRQVDIDLHQAQVRQAEAEVDLLINQIQEASLKSPTKGQITKIQKRVGEISQLTDIVISLLPSKPFQIEIDIYEEDIVKMGIGNPVDIEITAFQGKVFTGRVISIDPAEKLIDEIVYYEVIIDFDEILQSIKPGMTADVIIKTAERENVLVIPDSAIEERNGKSIIRILKGAKPTEREIKTGLEGSDDMVEVISGLTEGEKVIIE